MCIAASPGGEIENIAVRNALVNVLSHKLLLKKTKIPCRHPCALGAAIQLLSCDSEKVAMKPAPVYYTVP